MATRTMEPPAVDGAVIDSIATFTQPPKQWKPPLNAFKS